MSIEATVEAFEAHLIDTLETDLEPVAVRAHKYAQWVASWCGWYADVHEMDHLAVNVAELTGTATDFLFCLAWSVASKDDREWDELTEAGLAIGGWVSYLYRLGHMDRATSLDYLDVTWRISHLPNEPQRVAAELLSKAGFVPRSCAVPEPSPR